MAPNVHDRILLIGPLPKHESYGVGLGFDSLVSGFSTTKCDAKVIDIDAHSVNTKVGAFSIVRAMHGVYAVLSAWVALPGRQALYMTIASSRLGFARDMLIIWAAAWTNARIILHLKGGGYKEFYARQPGWLKRLIAITLGKSTHIVVLGNLLRSQFDFVPSIDAKLRVIPNGLTRGLNVPEHSKRLELRKRPFNILYLSNLIPSKGYLTLLEACARLQRTTDVDFVCNFCGAFTQTVNENHTLSAEQQKHEFFERIKRSGLRDNVLYHGTVGGKAKQKALEDAHVLVLPTWYPWEGQPISIIEALAFWTPVISTHHKGIPEQVMEGINGYLVPPDDPEALVQALLQIVRDEDEYELMSRAARQHFVTNFTREMHLNRLMQLICDGDPRSFEAPVRHPDVQPPE